MPEEMPPKASAPPAAGEGAASDSAAATSATATTGGVGDDSKSEGAGAVKTTEEGGAGEGGLTQSQRPGGKKRKVALFIAYVGEGYNGMQRNPGVPTIEEDLEKAIVKAGGISEENKGSFAKIHWNRAARTDKGVSAVGQVVSLKMMIGHENMLGRLNDALPPAITAFGFKRVTAGFDARKLCDCRLYEYVLPAWCFDPEKKGPETLARAARREERRAAEAGRSGGDGDEEPCAELVEANAAAAAALEAAMALEAALAAAEAPAPVEPAPAGPSEPAADGADAVASGGGPFAFGDDEQARLTTILQQYVGTHNFHNFTLRTAATDNDACRHIRKFFCKDTFELDGAQWVRIHVLGDSFMLHQIRKMIAAAVAEFRGEAPPGTIKKGLDPDYDVGVPMAPALGLFLHSCYFKAYNDRWGETHEHLDADEYAPQCEAFKRQRVYPHIAKTDAAERINEEFLDDVSDGKARWRSWAHLRKMRDMKAITAEKRAAQRAAAQKRNAERGIQPRSKKPRRTQDADVADADVAGADVAAAAGADAAAQPAAEPPVVAADVAAA